MWFTFAVAALTTARLTRLVTVDGITERARYLIFRRFPPNATRGRKAHWLGRLIDCPWCVSVYVSFGVVAVLAQYADVPYPVIQFPAVAYVAALLAAKLDS